MKPITLTFVTVLLFVTVIYSQTTFLIANKQYSPDTKEIAEKILRTLQDGWNTANGARFAQPFADVAEFVDVRGTLHQNASPHYLGEAHQGLFRSIYKDSKITYSLVQAIMIDENTILANARAALDTPAGPLAGKSASTISLLLIKTGEDWKIRAFHNTLVVKQ